MVKFLLDAGADQEHKTDEMHTALMEASMDGHVEVARLLLDSGAQVSLTLALPIYHQDRLIFRVLSFKCFFIRGVGPAVILRRPPQYTANPSAASNFQV